MCCKKNSMTSGVRYYDSSDICIRMLICLCLLSLIASPFVLMHGTNTWIKLLTSAFHRSQCTLAEVNMTSQNVTCACGDDCIGVYPCVVISVRAVDEKLESHQAVMYHSLSELKLKKCSFTPVCTAFESHDNVTSYAKELQAKHGNPFSCFRNSDTGEVVQNKDNNIASHHILWAIIMSVVILIDISTCFICSRKCMANRQSGRRESALGIISEYSRGSTYEAENSFSRKLSVV